MKKMFVLKKFVFVLSAAENTNTYTKIRFPSAATRGKGVIPALVTVIGLTERNG